MWAWWIRAFLFLCEKSPKNRNPYNIMEENTEGKEWYKLEKNAKAKKEMPLEERVKQLEDQLKSVASVNLELHESAQKNRFHAEDILFSRTNSIERMLFSAIFFCSFLFPITNVMMIANVNLPHLLTLKWGLPAVFRRICGFRPSQWRSLWLDSV